jgi:hypothetical protein
MIGGFVFNLFGGSKTRKVSRKKRGGKIVLANNNNKNTQNGGHSSCGAHKKNQNGGQCGAHKINQNGGQCSARKINQNGGAKVITRNETPLSRQQGVNLSRRPRPPLSYAGMNASPRPWTHRKKTSGKKTSGKKTSGKKTSGKKTSSKKSDKQSQQKSGKAAPAPQKKRTGRRSSHSLAARAAAANPSLFN